MTAVSLHGPSYALGEIELRYHEIDDLQARAEEFRMVPDPALWGWGSVFRTERGLEAMAIDTGSATLRAAGLAPAEIDALVLCCTEVPGDADGHGQFLRTILGGLALGDIPFYGVNFNRCVNLLAGLDLAHALVSSGRYGRILVITTDRVLDESQRMANYALFSDAAASCVVSAGTDMPDGYRLLSCATAQDNAALDASNEISAELGKRVNERLLPPHELKVGDLAGLMHGNIFKPLLVMKERQAGFTTEQLWTDNIARVGHCFAADPLINLVDRAALGHVRPDQYHLLASSVPGSRIGVLIRTPAQ
jgi:3-oxoacyl-[acyl-carrier-protein] synthase-3